MRDWRKRQPPAGLLSRPGLGATGVRLLLVGLVLAAGLAACRGDNPAPDDEPASDEEPAMESFGADSVRVVRDDAVPVSAVVAEPARYVGDTVTVAGPLGGIDRGGCRAALVAERPFHVYAHGTATAQCSWTLPDRLAPATEAAAPPARDSLPTLVGRGVVRDRGELGFVVYSRRVVVSLP